MLILKNRNKILQDVNDSHNNDRKWLKCILKSLLNKMFILIYKEWLTYNIFFCKYNYDY
ncbi:hypothetical protein GM3709_1594 [Geminocystis sp. NIES-3709]|nr:hypothetical protein GM3709_1594 [Geminocystis sp. NIES-3709]